MTSRQHALLFAARSCWRLMPVEALKLLSLLAFGAWFGIVLFDWFAEGM